MDGCLSVLLLGRPPVLPPSLLPPGFMASVFRKAFPLSGPLIQPGVTGPFLPTPGRCLPVAFSSHPSSVLEEALN